MWGAEFYSLAQDSCSFKQMRPTFLIGNNKLNITICLCTIPTSSYGNVAHRMWVRNDCCCVSLYVNSASDTNLSIKTRDTTMPTSTLQAGDGLQFIFEALFLPNIINIQQLQVMNRQLSLTIIKTTLFLPALSLHTWLFSCIRECRRATFKVSQKYAESWKYEIKHLYFDHVWTNIWSVNKSKIYFYFQRIWNMNHTVKGILAA